MADEYVQTPQRLVNMDCQPGGHVWNVVHEGADPEPHQTCECGMRRWATTEEWIRTGEWSRPVKNDPSVTPAGRVSPNGESNG